MNLTSNGPPPDEPAIDYEGSLRRMGGDRKLFSEMAAFFREDGPALLRDLAAALATGNPEQVTRAAHSLKGLAANFGAQSLVSAAVNVEQAGRAGDLKGAAMFVPPLEHWVMRVISELEDLLAHRAG